MDETILLKRFKRYFKSDTKAARQVYRDIKKMHLEHYTELIMSIYNGESKTNNIVTFKKEVLK